MGSTSAEHEAYIREQIARKLGVGRLTTERLTAHLKQLGEAREPFEDRLYARLTGQPEPEQPLACGARAKAA